MAVRLTPAQKRALVQLAQAQQLAQQQGAILHGQHWQSSPQTYSSPTNGAGGGARGASAYISTAGTFTGWVTLPEGKPSPIPYAGIRTGEIIGHRLWWVVGLDSPHPRLCSFAHHYIWEPGQVVRGDINEPVSPSLMGGVYAYGDKIQVEVETAHIEDLVAGGALLAYSSWLNFLARKQQTFIYGTIKMWGEVVQHELGYRSEFAKPVELISSHGERCPKAVLDYLRSVYLTEEKPAPLPRPEIDSSDWTGR